MTLYLTAIDCDAHCQVSKIQLLCSVAAIRNGFQEAIYSMLTHKQSGISEEEGAILLSAALYEQLVEANDSMGRSARILKNALSEFPPHVSPEAIL